MGGGWKNFEECGRKDLEQIVSRNGMLMTLLVKTEIGVSYMLQKTEQKLIVSCAMEGKVCKFICK